jgi:hypothetical protein
MSMTTRKLMMVAVAIGIAATIALAAGAFEYGRHIEAQGNQRAIERLQARIEAADMRARDAALKLIEAERQAADLAATLEEQANEDPDADRRAFGRDSVRRIFNR